MLKNEELHLMVWIGGIFRQIQEIMGEYPSITWQADFVNKDFKKPRTALHVENLKITMEGFFGGLAQEILNIEEIKSCRGDAIAFTIKAMLEKFGILD